MYHNLKESRTYHKVEAAYIILKEYGRPLHLKEIIRIALKKKMIKTKGKTPESTLNSNFYKENKRRAERGEDLRFYRVGKAMWGLTEWGLASKKEETDKP
ncbi:winged helix-turn-helix domain-containing protein [Chloroflexota bacterium]